MSLTMTLIVGVAVAGLLGLFIAGYLRNRDGRLLLFQLVPLAMAVLVLNRLFGFPIATPQARARGDDSELPMIAILFTCMVLGMLAHWLHHWLATPRRTRKAFDAGALVAPVLASPIVFIPLLASLQTANLDLQQWDIPRFMLFLVAFENGFFWKEYFDNRRQRIADDKG